MKTRVPPTRAGGAPVVSAPGARAVAAYVVAAVLVVVASGGCAPAEAQEPAAAPGGAQADGPAADDLPASAAAARGAASYLKWCVGCHGEEGRGDGPAAVFLDPLPRDFQAGAFKFRSTPSGSLPTPDDLLRTITNGLHGSSMPAFPLVPEPERRDLAEHVLHLAQFGRLRIEADSAIAEDGLTMQQFRAERLAAVRERLAERRRAAQPIGIPPETANDAASVARGKELYAKMCLSCHGATGIGDGPSSYALRDGRDAPILPRDFTTGVLRGGDTPQDLFRRMKTGLDGTPMPAFGNPDAELWDIVHFVMTLRRAPAEESVR